MIKEKDRTISRRIDEILECGFRYAKFKLCLRRNREKVDSRFLTYDELLKRLKEEVYELEQEMKKKGLLGIKKLNPETQMIESVAKEAGDIINFAAMICDKTEGV
ncbi:hypothetical protein AGMMS49944_03720 [Spirochaetia bacterium]|nr:hypothetical protein AGMMS49944_03720 [Spirochaetia bacterium]